MKILKFLAGLLLLLVLALAVMYLFRSDPIGPIAGRQLSGPEMPYPADWEFSNESMTIAVESNPAEPHSVTNASSVVDHRLQKPMDIQTVYNILFLQILTYISFLCFTSHTLGFVLFKVWSD